MRNKHHANKTNVWLQFWSWSVTIVLKTMKNHKYNLKQNTIEKRKKRGKLEPIDVEGQFSVEEGREVLPQKPKSIPQIHVIFLLFFFFFLFAPSLHWSRKMTVRSKILIQTQNPIILNFATPF